MCGRALFEFFAMTIAVEVGILALSADEVTLFDSAAVKGAASEVIALLEVLRPDLMSSADPLISHAAIQRLVAAYAASRNKNNTNNSGALRSNASGRSASNATAGSNGNAGAVAASSRRSSLGGGGTAAAGRYVSGGGGSTHTYGAANTHAYGGQWPEQQHRTTPKSDDLPPPYSDFSSVPLLGVSKSEGRGGHIQPTSLAAKRERTVFDSDDGGYGSGRADDPFATDSGNGRKIADASMYRQRSRNSSVDNSDRGRSDSEVSIRTASTDHEAEDRHRRSAATGGSDSPARGAGSRTPSGGVVMGVPLANDNHRRAAAAGYGGHGGYGYIGDHGHTVQRSDYVYNPSDFEDLTHRWHADTEDVAYGANYTSNNINYNEGYTAVGKPLRAAFGPPHGSVSHEALFRYAQLRAHMRREAGGSSAPPAKSNLSNHSHHHNRHSHVTFVIDGDSDNAASSPSPSSSSPTPAPEEPAPTPCAGSPFLDFYRGATTIASPDDGAAMDVMSLISQLPLATDEELPFLTTNAFANALFPIAIAGDSKSDNTHISRPLTAAEVYFAKRDDVVRLRIIGLIECFIAAMGLETIGDGGGAICFEKATATPAQQAALSDPSQFRNCLRAIHLLAVIGQAPTAKGLWAYFSPKLGHWEDDEGGAAAGAAEDAALREAILRSGGCSGGAAVAPKTDAERMAAAIASGTGGIADGYVARFGAEGARRMRDVKAKGSVQGSRRGSSTVGGGGVVVGHVLSNNDVNDESAAWGVVASSPAAVTTTTTTVAGGGDCHSLFGLSSTDTIPAAALGDRPRPRLDAALFGGALRSDTSTGSSGPLHPTEAGDHQHQHQHQHSSGADLSGGSHNNMYSAGLVPALSTDYSDLSLEDRYASIVVGQRRGSSAGGQAEAKAAGGKEEASVCVAADAADSDCASPIAQGDPSAAGPQGATPADGDADDDDAAEVPVLPLGAGSDVTAMVRRASEGGDANMFSNASGSCGAADVVAGDDAHISSRRDSRSGSHPPSLPASVVRRVADAARGIASGGYTDMDADVHQQK